jgi:hypothetical protein
MKIVNPLFLVVFIFSSITTIAQTRGFGITPIIGIANTIPIPSNVDGSSFILRNYDNRSTFLYGLQIQYKANNYFSFHTGCLPLASKYELKQNFDFTLGDLTLKEEIISTENLSYLNLPLFARLNTKPIQNFKAFIDIGAYFSYLLKSNMEVNRKTMSILDSSGYITESQTTQSMEMDTKSRRENWDAGLLLGLGGSYSFNKIVLSAGVQFLSSATHINLSNSGKNNVQPIQYWDYFILEDLIRLNYLTFNLGLTYHFNQ